MVDKLFVFIFVFVFSILLNAKEADDITELLDNYQVVAETHTKTKKESLGHVVVYTQQDLKMMQAHKLRDVLKILPGLSVQTNLFGVSNLTYAGNPNGVSTSMRVYINNHELSSLQTLSPWLIYENYPLDHINHIEVYWGESSLSLGNEPATLTIKLYTKNPKRLNSNTLKTSLDTKESLNMSLSTGYEYGNDVTLLAMINSANQNNPATYYNGNDIKNDNERIFAYASLGIDDFIVDVGYAKLEKDTFLGLAKDISPDSGEIESQDYFLSVTKYFNNSDGKIYFAVDRNERKFKEINAEGSFVLPVIDMTNALSTIPKSYTEDLTFTKYDFSLSKKFNINSHEIFLSSSLKYKDYEVNQRELISLNNSTIANNFNGIKNESIVSLMAGDNYYFNSENVLIFDLKYDKYKKSGNFESFSEISNRVGFVSTLNKNFGVKAFVIKSFMPPSMYEIDFADNGNKDLKAESKKTYSIEGVYEDDKNRLSLFLNKFEIQNSIVLGDMAQGKLGFVNSDTKNNGRGISIDYTRKFDAQNKLNFVLYKLKNNQDIYQSPKEGAILKAFQNLDNFGFYEEVVFKNGYKYNNIIDVDKSYNLSLGVNYEFSKDLIFSLKGENLLDDDMDIVYVDRSDLQNIKYKTISNSDRRISATLKWVF